MKKPIQTAIEWVVVVVVAMVVAYIFAEAAFGVGSVVK